MASEAGGRPREEVRESSAPPPWVIFLCGALAMGFCLLLLFGPFYEDRAAPAARMRMLLLILLEGRGLYVLSELLWDRFTLLVVVLFGVVMVLLPWYRALQLQGQRQRRRGAPSSSEPDETVERGSVGDRRTTPVDPAASLIFSDDGRLLDANRLGEKSIRRSVAELSVMADAAGIRWQPDFATAGGARALLEILRFLETENETEFGAVAGAKTETGAGTGLEDAPNPETAATLSPERDAAVVGGAAVTPQPVAVQAAAESPRSPEEDSAEELETGSEDLSGGYRVSEPSWTPSYSGSVYTSTTLYYPEVGEPEDTEDEGEKR